MNSNRILDERWWQPANKFDPGKQSDGSSRSITWYQSTFVQRFFRLPMKRHETQDCPNLLALGMSDRRCAVHTMPRRVKTMVLRNVYHAFSRAAVITGLNETVHGGPRVGGRPDA
jgi:hypothetical protein